MVSTNTLEDQICRTRETLGLPKDAGFHALRHTFLTRAGKLTQNVKALQLVGGHSNIATTMKYIHPHEGDVFKIVAAVAATSQAKKRSSHMNASARKLAAAKAAGA
jgi:integrase